MSAELITRRMRLQKPDGSGADFVWRHHAVEAEVTAVVDLEALIAHLAQRAMESQNFRASVAFNAVTVTVREVAE